MSELENLLIQLNEIVGECFKNGTLDLHKTILIDNFGARILSDEIYVPSSEIDD